MTDGVDILGDVLRRVALRATVYFKADFGTPWGMAIPDKDVAAFHIVVKGRCAARLDGQWVTLEQGSMVLVPHGAAHALAHAPEVHLQPANELLSGESGEHFGGAGETCTLICGHFERRTGIEHPLFATLPPAIILAGPRESVDADWMATASELAVRECERAAAGGSAIVDRLAEALLIQVLRAWSVDTNAPDGFLRALADHGLTRALSAIHQSPEEAWSVESLARVASMSRATFAGRFRDVVGLTPVAYLTDWRMRIAHELLCERPNLSTSDIAEQVGYASEVSFSKAFKRLWNESPAQVRRSAVG